MPPFAGMKRKLTHYCRDVRADDARGKGHYNAETIVGYRGEMNGG